MNRWLLSAAALALAAPVLAAPVKAAPAPFQFAQNDQDQHKKHGDHKGDKDQDHGQQGSQQDWDKLHQEKKTNEKLRDENMRDRDRLHEQKQEMNYIRHGEHFDWHAYTPGHRPPDWDARHRNFDRTFWQRNFNAEHRYHWRAYERPRGWYEHHWVYGEVLPSLFWSRDYWIDSYSDFGLSDPPYGYVWVRDGDDALLVDVGDGTILRVVYGVFY